MKFHVNVFIVSASRGQKPQFWANFDINWGLLYRTQFILMRVKFCVLEETQGIHLHTKFHVNVFWTNFDIGGGLLYRSPFTDEVQI